MGTIASATQPRAVGSEHLLSTTSISSNLKQVNNSPALKAADAEKEAADLNYRAWQASPAVSDLEQKSIQDASKTAIEKLKVAAADPAKRALLAKAIGGKDAKPEQIAKIEALLIDFVAGKIPTPKFIAAQTTSEEAVFKGQNVGSWIGKDVIPSDVEAAYIAGPQGGRVLVNPALSEAKLNSALLHELGHMLEAASKSRGITPGVGEVGERIELAMEGKDPLSVAEYNQASGANIVMVRVDGKLVKAVAAFAQSVAGYKNLYPVFLKLSSVAQNDVLYAYAKNNRFISPTTTRAQFLNSPAAVAKTKREMSTVLNNQQKSNMLRTQMQRVVNSNPTWKKQMAQLVAYAADIAHNATPRQAADFNVQRPSFGTELQAVLHLVGTPGLDDQYVTEWTDKVNKGNAARGADRANGAIRSGDPGLPQKAIDLLRNARVPVNKKDRFDQELQKIRAIFTAGALRGSVAWVRMSTAMRDIAAALNAGRALTTAEVRSFEGIILSVAKEPKWQALLKQAKIAEGTFSNVLKILIAPMVVVGMGLDFASGAYKTAPGPFALRLAGNLSYTIGLPTLVKSGWDGLRQTFGASAAAQAAEVEMQVMSRTASVGARASSSGTVATLMNSAERTNSGRPLTVLQHEALAANEVANVERGGVTAAQINAATHVIGTDAAHGGAVVRAAGAGAEAANAAEAATLGARLSARVINGTLMKATFGVGDILIGAATIWQGANDLHAHRKTKGGLEIASGTFNSAAGVAMLAALAVPVAAPVLAPIAAVCTVVGAALSIASFFW